jgi:hypothetical protein
MRMNGQVYRRWPVAEVHFKKMAARYVTPTIAYAQGMITNKPWLAPARVAAILNTIREMEAVRKLYTGPISRSMEQQLADADKRFRLAMKRLEEWDH